MDKSLPSLRLLVSVVVLAPIIVVSTALLALSGYTSRRIEAQLSQSLVNATSTLVTREIHNGLQDAQWISDLYVYHIQSGALPTTVPSPAWDRLMVGSLTNRSTLASIAYATPDGKASYVMRLGDSLVAGHADGTGHEQTREYLCTPQGTVVEPPLGLHTYNVLIRPWYELAVRSDKPVWTPVYAWFEQNVKRVDSPPVPSLGYTRALRDADGNVTGVLSVDVSLASVGELLRDADIAGRGTLAVMDDQHRVLCHSEGRPPMGLISQLPTLDAMPGDDYRVINAHLQESSPGHVHRVQIRTEGRYVSVEPITPFPGVEWHLAVVVPEDVINIETRRMQQQMVAVGGLCVAGALGIGLWLSHWLAAPVLRMVDAVRRIGGNGGNLDVKFEPPRTGEMAALTGALSDMTRQLKEQVALRAAKEAAESSNRARSAFFARATHELRTPLNSIIGYSEMIEEQEVVQRDAQVRDDVRRVLQASRQLLNVINNVLDLAKIESGKLSVSLTDASMPNLLDEVQETAQPLAQRNGNVLRFDVADDVLAFRTDPHLMRQVLLNLLANSARFTQNGQITLSAERDRSHLHLSVRDTGMGIPADKIGRLFEPFYQVDERSGGTGLGLPIVQQLVSALGGAIEIRSEVGVGTTVDLYFPLIAPTAASVANGATWPRDAAEADHSTVRHDELASVGGENVARANRSENNARSATTNDAGEKGAP